MLRYAHETELDRLRRSNRRTRVICGMLLPIEIVGLVYLLNYLFSF